MKKKILQLIFMLIILLGVVIAIFHFVNKEEDKTFTDAEILEILSEKSGIDFRDSIIQEVEKVYISEGSSGIEVILQIDKTEKELIEAEIAQMRHERLESNDMYFPKVWKEKAEEAADYAYYEVYNGARKKAKSLNETDCFFVLDESQSFYIGYIGYAGD